MKDDQVNNCYKKDRKKMLTVDLVGRGITDPRVLNAMENVPRHLFISREKRNESYADRALPIEEGQTISQPYIVAFTAQALSIEPGSQVLEIGTGSGYAAAILAEMQAKVVTIERSSFLASKARNLLNSLGYKQIEVIEGDGSVGLLDRAPFDAISVSAAAPSVPEPLVQQLADGGRLVVPVGKKQFDQKLIQISRQGKSIRTQELLSVVFVPLLGEAGW